jgi:hypothetical protein
MNVVWGVLLAAFLLIDPGKIGKINTLKSEAKDAFQAKDFKTAIAKYKYLVDSLGLKEEEVTMNLAHSYFQNQDTVNALNTYLPLTQSQDRKIKSLANQQLGVLSNRQSKLEDALNYFKQALKAAPENEDARFNYEMVKKKLEEQKKQEQQQNQDKNKENKDQQDKKDQKQDQKDKKDQNKDQKDKDQKDKKDQEKKDQQEKEKKEQEKKDQEKKDQDKKPQSEEQKKADKNKEKKEIPPSVSDKLKEMQMSEEKAKMILEAMKHQEIQYLQQNKRKATKPKDKSKPDW